MLSRWLDRHSGDAWRYAYRMWSVQITLLLAGLEGAYAAIPAFQNVFPPVHFLILCTGVSVLVAIVRLIKQRSVPDHV
jgi:uncharacterized membrane protein YoaK (UPF0700 family)